MTPNEMLKLLRASACAHFDALAATTNDKEVLELLSSLDEIVKGVRKIFLPSDETPGDDQISRQQISEKNRKVIEKVIAILRISDEPVTTAALVDMLRKMKIQVHERDPVSYLSALLSRASDISKVDDGWSVKNLHIDT